MLNNVHNLLLDSSNGPCYIPINENTAIHTLTSYTYKVCSIYWKNYSNIKEIKDTKSPRVPHGKTINLFFI